MNFKTMVGIAVAGILAAILSAIVYNHKINSAPPLAINYNPYTQGVYATGIIESYQQNGANINIFPDVSGKVDNILVKDGQLVQKDTPIISIDPSVQQAIVEKDAAQARAALSMLQELQAQPRKENLNISIAQYEYAKASLKNARDQLDKIYKSYHLNPQSVSKNDLDNAINAVKIAQANLKVAKTQLDLTKAGAWIYDIKNQENQYKAAMQNYLADKALLAKFTIKAPIDGVILSVNTAVGSYVSSQGAYDPYAQTMIPIAQMGSLKPYMEVRCFLNEVLTPQLPNPSHLEAKMFIRGQTSNGIPLEFERIQPYTIPNIELSAERSERVDVRVLPIIFRFKKPPELNIFAGQLVDVYIRGKK